MSTGTVMLPRRFSFLFHQQCKQSSPPSFRLFSNLLHHIENRVNDELRLVRLNVVARMLCDDLLAVRRQCQ